MPKCSVCGRTISESEAITYNGMCKRCYSKDETELDMAIEEEWIDL